VSIVTAAATQRIIVTLPDRLGMKIYDAYRLAIEEGMKRDLRPQSEVKAILEGFKAAYDSLPDDRKELFDEERLWNPYADSRFSYGAEKAKELDAERFMWGIDITPSEMLLADRLREKGERIDAVIAHHPNGTSKTPFPEVMMQMTAMFSNMGMEPEKAEELVQRGWRRSSAECRDTTTIRPPMPQGCLTSLCSIYTPLPTTWWRSSCSGR
jgi:hypothetical protein